MLIILNQDTDLISYPLLFVDHVYVLFYFLHGSFKFIRTKGGTYLLSFPGSKTFYYNVTKCMFNVVNLFFSLTICFSGPKPVILCPVL